MIFLLLIFIQIAVFGTLIFVLRSFLKNQYGSASSQLESLNQEAERRLAESKKKTDEANAYYEQMVNSAKTDAAKLKQQILDEGAKEKLDLINRARKEADEIMDRARSARKLLEENWNEELTLKAKGVSLEALKAVLPSAMSQEIQTEWIKRVLASGMDGLSHLNIPDDLNKVKITSAFYLSEDQKKLILSMMKEKMKRQFVLEETIDPTLVLGFRMEIGSVVIDGSLFWKIKEALQNAGNQ